MRYYFNPRAHGGRSTQYNRFTRNISVSIHAPTRGATILSITLASVVEFQPTRPRGARPQYTLNTTIEIEFQPTRPRGARHDDLIDSPLDDSFQPTRPRGARRAALPSHARIVVSTHAPTRGATLQQSPLLLLLPGFNPRAHEGRDCSCCPLWAWRRTVSTHAPTRGAT